MSKWPYGTAQWQRLRAAKLSDQPLCEVCIRREVVEVATVVDHVTAIAKGGDPFPPLSGLMAMCEPCHNTKTNAVDHPNASGFMRALKGYDVDGNPIDPEGWAFEGREASGLVPAAQTNEDLVLILPNREASIWV
nr:HNH endonuclease signature motif containing protein [uncultured Shinella sp.]